MTCSVEARNHVSIIISKHRTSNQNLSIYDYMRHILRAEIKITECSNNICFTGFNSIICVMNSVFNDYSE